MTYDDYLKQIITFNSDKDIITLRERFNQPSFFEMISRERSETTYSAFLRWLFQDSQDGQTSNPLTLLLDLLVRRCEEQKDYVKSVLTNEYVKRSVVTRGITVKNVRATTEKSVSSLTQEIILNARRSIRTGIIPDSDLTKIAAKSQDRMDLFIECDIESDNKAVIAKSLQIIVENKIDAGKGGILPPRRAQIFRRPHARGPRRRSEPPHPRLPFFGAL